MISACIDRYDVECAARVPLPLSVPATPKPRLSPLVLKVDIGWLESARSARSLYATPITLIFTHQTDDADESPVSSSPDACSASSDSSTCSSGPTTPVELKQVFEVPRQRKIKTSLSEKLWMFPTTLTNRRPTRHHPLSNPATASHPTGQSLHSRDHSPNLDACWRPNPRLQMQCRRLMCRS